MKHSGRCVCLQLIHLGQYRQYTASSLFVYHEIGIITCHCVYGLLLQTLLGNRVKEIFGHLNH